MDGTDTTGVRSRDFYIIVVVDINFNIYKWGSSFAESTCSVTTALLIIQLFHLYNTLHVIKQWLYIYSVNILFVYYVIIFIRHLPYFVLVFVRIEIQPTQRPNSKLIKHWENIKFSIIRFIRTSGRVKFLIRRMTWWKLSKSVYTCVRDIIFVKLFNTRNLLERLK